MRAPKRILELVETFDLHRDAYMSPAYNETQVRRQFIDPMFEAMGWDIDNKAAYAEQYLQVVHEDSLKVGDTAYFIPMKDLYLLGLLNSRLFWFSISNISIPFGTRAGQYRYRLIYQYMKKSLSESAIPMTRRRNLSTIE